MPTVIQIAPFSRSRRGHDPVAGSYEGWHAQFGRQVAGAGRYRVECWSQDVACSKPLAYERDGVAYRLFPVQWYLSPGREVSTAMVDALRAAPHRDDMIVHLHDPHTWQSYAIAHALRSIPVVAHYHGATRPPLRKLRSWRRVPLSPLLVLEHLAEQRALRGFRHVLIANQGAERYFRERGLSTSLCPMAPDLNIFQTVDQRVARQRLGLPDQLSLLLHVGGFARPKGLELLIAAFAQLRARQPALLILAGPTTDRGYRQSILALIRRRGLLSDVLVIGTVPRTELNHYYNAADLLAVSSQPSEGGPVAALEALAVGTPVVATRVGFLPEFLNRANGLVRLVEPAADQLALAFSSVLQEHRPVTPDRPIARPWTWSDVVRTANRTYDDLLQ